MGKVQVGDRTYYDGEWDRGLSHSEGCESSGRMQRPLVSRQAGWDGEIAYSQYDVKGTFKNEMKHGFRKISNGDILLRFPNDEMHGCGTMPVALE